MSDARYLRAQADLCLEIAREMSDPKAAESMKQEAARYRALAGELDVSGDATSQPAAKPE